MLKSEQLSEKPIPNLNEMNENKHVFLLHFNNVSKLFLLTPSVSYWSTLGWICHNYPTFINLLKNLSKNSAHSKTAAVTLIRTADAVSY